MKKKLRKALFYMSHVDYAEAKFCERKDLDEYLDGNMGTSVLGDTDGDPVSDRAALLPVSLFWRALVIVLSPILMPIHQIRVASYDRKRKKMQSQVHRPLVGDIEGDCEKDTFWLVTAIVYDMHSREEEKRFLEFLRQGGAVENHKIGGDN